MPLLQYANNQSSSCFSDANDFVESLPGIPTYQQAKSYEENHGKFSILFNKKGQTRISNPVYKAAYWGNTPLHLACNHKGQELIKILLKHGAEESLFYANKVRSFK